MIIELIIRHNRRLPSSNRFSQTSRRYTHTKLNRQKDYTGFSEILKHVDDRIKGQCHIGTVIDHGEYRPLSPICEHIYGVISPERLMIQCSSYGVLQPIFE